MDETQDPARRGSARTRSGKPSEQSGLTLTGEALANARWLAEQGDITVAEAVRRSLAAWRFLVAEQMAGGVVKLESKTGDLERVHFIYT